MIICFINVIINQFPLSYGHWKFFKLFFFFFWLKSRNCLQIFNLCQKVARLPPECNVTFESVFSINSFCCTFLPPDDDIFQE